MVFDPNRRGARLDLELLAQYRASKGPRKQHLGAQLLYENEPLLKTLTDQLLGQGPAKKNDLKLPGSAMYGLRELDWHDAMQAARLAFLKAIEPGAFDPQKGKLTGYVKFKILYELQCMVRREGLAEVPRNNPAGRIDIDLVGEQQELDERSRGHDLAGIFESDAFERQDVERWMQTGEWPEDEQEARADVAKARFEAIRTSATAWLAYSLPRIFVIDAMAATETRAAFDWYRLTCRRNRAPEVARAYFVRGLERAEMAVERWVRIPRPGFPARQPCRGLIGVTIRPQSA